MTDQLAINLEYLSLHDKYLYKKVMLYLENEKIKQIELSINERGFVNLIYNKTASERYYLYSEDAVNQKNWLSEHEILNYGFHEVILLGLGLTYHLADLIQLNPHLLFYIHEPRIDIFIETLKIINIKDILEHPQVKMLSIGNTEVDMLHFIYYRNAKSLFRYYSICVPFYMSIEEEFVKKYYEEDYRLTTVDLASITFEKTFGQLPFKNAIRNLLYVNQTPSLKWVGNIFKGCTAVVVGAGPSLEPDIELLKSIQNKVFIISAGSAIQSLLKHGITPHLMVSIDPGVDNGRVYENINYQDIPLAYSLHVYSPIVENKKDGMFHFSLNTEMLAENILDKKIDPMFYTTTTVSGTSIQIASFLGADQIVLVGQDLSFPNKQYYASGASHQADSYLNEQLDQAALEVPNVSGGVNATNMTMVMAREGIEEVIQNFIRDDVQVYNASSLGAVINGAPFIKLSEIVEGVAEHSYDFNQLNTATDIGDDEYYIKEKVEKHLLVISDFKKYCKDTLKIVSDYEVASRKSFTAANNKLIQLEETFKQISNTSFFNEFLVLWCRFETRDYDAKVMLIDLEPNMIKKSKLLQEILVPYVKVIQKILEDVQEEYTSLLQKL